MKRRIQAVVLNDTRVDRHHGCSRVMSAIEALLAREGVDVLASCPAHADWRADSKFLKSLESSALIVVNGEGTLHHDRPAARKLLEIGSFARTRGIPAVLINAGWEANSPALSALLDNFAITAVRDTRSALSLKAVGRCSQVVPDLSLYAKSVIEPRNINRTGIGFTDSVERRTSVSLERLRRGMGGIPISIHASIDQWRERACFLRGAVARADLTDPMFLLSSLIARKIQLAASVPQSEDFVSALAALQLLVSGRYHACTLALFTMTPFVAFESNTSKISALMHDAGLRSERMLVNPMLSDILDFVDAGWSPMESESIRAYLHSAKSLAESLFAEIRKLVC